MCIIAIKKAGVAAPNKEMFETMWCNNPDGAGFMYAANGAVCIEKGFMKYESFAEAYRHVANKIDIVATPMVFHFRITTHGGTSAENTHPFPITDNLGLLRKLSSKTSVGVAHNGILSIQPRKGISDTMEYVLTQLNTMRCINKKFPQDKHFRALIEGEIGGSKLAFLDADGKINTVGDFITDEKTGLMFSNSSYETARFSSMHWGAYKPVCDVADLGGRVMLDGNEYIDYGTFYVDKTGKLYGYDWEEDILYPTRSAEVVGKINYKKDEEVYIPYSSMCYFEDMMDGDADYARCYWCGELKNSSELHNTELGLLCDDCIAELER